MGSPSGPRGDTEGSTKGDEDRVSRRGKPSTYPPGHIYDPGATCRDCGSPIVFKVTAFGGYQPVEVDSLEPHAMSCPAERKAALNPKACNRCSSLNVTWSNPHPDTAPGGLLHCNDCNRARWLPRGAA